MKRILLVSVILAAMLLAGCAAPVTTPEPTPTPAPAETAPTPALTEQPATSPTLALLKIELETFLTYNKFQQLDKMWSMLHPDIQGIYGDVDEFEFITPFTVSAWIYPETTSNGAHYIVSKGGGAPNGWALRTTSSDIQFISNSQIAEFSYNFYTWYFVTGVYDGNDLNLYINGVFKDSQNTGLSIKEDNHFNIGGGNFNGIIDEIHIWNRELSIEEIENLYNATKI